MKKKLGLSLKGKSPAVKLVAFGLGVLIISSVFALARVSGTATQMLNWVKKINHSEEATEDTAKTKTIDLSQDKSSNEVDHNSATQNPAPKTRSSSQTGSPTPSGSKGTSQSIYSPEVLKAINDLKKVKSGCSGSAVDAMFQEKQNSLLGENIRYQATLSWYATDPAALKAEEARHQAAISQINSNYATQSAAYAASHNCTF